MFKSRKTFFKKERERGVSIFLALVIMSMLMGIGFGISTIFVGQSRVLAGIGDSVLAFYAAETGVERILRLDICLIIADEATREICIEEVINDDDAGTLWIEMPTPSCANEPINNEMQCRINSTALITDVTLSNGAAYALFIRPGGGGCTGISYCGESTGTFETSNRKTEITR